MRSRFRPGHPRDLGVIAESALLTHSDQDTAIAFEGFTGVSGEDIVDQHQIRFSPVESHTHI
jgi:hypothetical protein